MNYRQKQALQTVIDYLYDDEEEHYSELQDEGEDVRGKRKMMVPHCGHYWHTTHRQRTSVRASDRQTGQKD